MNFERSKVTIALRKSVIGAGFLVVVVLALLWLAGAFHKKIGTTVHSGLVTAFSGHPIGNARLVPVRRIRIPRVESSVGTIKAVHEAAVASKLLAKVVDVRAIAGQRVEAGDLLAQLDDADLKARLEQAQAAAPMIHAGVTS